MFNESVKHIFKNCHVAVKQDSIFQRQMARCRCISNSGWYAAILYIFSEMPTSVVYLVCHCSSAKNCFWYNSISRHVTINFTHQTYWAQCRHAKHNRAWRGYIWHGHMGVCSVWEGTEWHARHARRDYLSLVRLMCTPCLQTKISIFS